MISWLGWKCRRSNLLPFTLLSYHMLHYTYPLHNFLFPTPVPRFGLSVWQDADGACDSRLEILLFSVADVVDFTMHPQHPVFLDAGILHGRLYFAVKQTSDYGLNYIVGASSLESVRELRTEMEMQFFEHSSSYLVHVIWNFLICGDICERC